MFCLILLITSYMTEFFLTPDGVVDSEILIFLSLILGVLIRGPPEAVRYIFFIFEMLFPFKE